MSLVLEPRAIVETLRPRREAIRRRLSRVRRRLRARLALSGLTWTWTTLFALAAASLAGDWLLRFSLPLRQLLLGAAVVGLAATVYRRLLKPLAIKFDDLDLAAILDRRCRGFGQRVAAVIELPRLLEGDVSASPSMVHAAVLEHAAALDATDLSAAFDRRGPRRMFALLAATGLAAAAFACLAPDAAGLWARRWFKGSFERWPQRNYLAIAGLADRDTLLVPRGESLLVQLDAQPAFSGAERAWTLDGRGETLTIATAERPAGEIPEKVGIQYRAAGGGSKQGNFTNFQGGRFRYELPPIAEPVEFHVTGGDDWFGPIQVKPIDRPKIDQLSIAARAPRSDRSETFAHAGADAPLVFLVDTELELQFSSSVPLASAELSSQAGAVPKLERVDDSHYVARWKMQEAQTLEIRLVGRQAQLESKPYYVSIGLLIDRAPRLSLRSSGVGKRVTPQAKIPLHLRAQDDFGLASLGLELEQTVPHENKPQTSTRRIAIELPAEADGRAATDFETQPVVALAEYALAAGTLVKLRAAATDNRAQGSQEAASRWLNFQLATPEELFYEILMRQRAERAKFAAALETAKAQSGPLAGAATAEQIAGAARKHQLAARQVWQVANRLDATLEEMTLNELGGEQARELLKTKVIDAIRQLHSEPMARLRLALDSAGAEEPAAEALVEARQRHEEVVETMQKILEQMSQWENFIDVLNQLKEIVKLQNDVLQSTEQEKKKKTNDLFDE
ncbi:MAG TPA: hypothetical protein VGN42_19740 [Pirellulales bacterium]|nr:hypothetical protein [Pirellulales bacterium]